MKEADFDQYYQKGGAYLIPNEVLYELVCDWDDLIKYLESMLDGNIKDKFVVISVVDLLERIKSGNYE